MRARRTRGEGSMFQRCDPAKGCPPMVNGERPAHNCRGLWVARVSLGLVDGKPARKQVTARTKRELSPKLRALQRDIEAGVRSDNMSVTGWLRHWLTNIAPHDLKPRSLSTYRGYTETWLIPNIGAHRLVDLENDHVRSLHRVMERAGKSPATIRQVHMILRKALAVAVLDKKIRDNVAVNVNPPKVDKSHGHGVLSRDEAWALMDLLQAYGDDGLWWVTSRYLVALLEGLRQGEALGLRWEDIDWTPGDEAINLVRQVQRQQGKGLVVAPLKSSDFVGDGRRVPLMPPVTEALRKYRESAPDGYVWGGEKPTDPRRDWGVWKGVLWSAGIPDRPLHAARATTASILGDAKVPLKTIAEVLGHSQITTAWTHYVKADERQKREGIEAAWKSISERPA